MSKHKKKAVLIQVWDDEDKHWVDDAQCPSVREAEKAIKAAGVAGKYRILTPHRTVDAVQSEPVLLLVEVE